MPRQSIWSPLNLLIAGLTVIVILLVIPDQRIAAVPPRDEHYPPPTLTALARQTASTSTSTAIGTAVATQIVPATSAPTMTGVVPTRAAAAPTAPLFTPTLAAERTCAPGVPVEISGTGPPRAAYLLYFDQRAVSGGSVGPDGRFRITLVVGSERAGTYTVTVQVRGTRQVLRSFTCLVPEATPTPLPVRAVPQ